MIWDPKQRLFGNVHFFVKIVKFGNPYFDEFETDSKFGIVKREVRLIFCLIEKIGKNVTPWKSRNI